ncbi:hypothetical protein [Desulfobacter postgatei]|uniref:hypothetical protein n=1 Tax=Desulfobacter postgatei TaxID=2293 RepID=UPI00259B86DD|nr:hypothetical protein [uncultured Desulfobacter sp.]
MPNMPAVTINQALSSLEQQGTPESMAILNYVRDLKQKNVATLGTDEAFVLQDGQGQIKAFKSVLKLSEHEGTLVQPVYNGPFIVSAQGYEVWAERTGTSVIFPKEVLVGTEWKPNPYAERDPNNRRILAVHARAVAFKFSSMGIPQVSDWTTIFDTPSYRMIDLLGKAKKFPQCFKVLPKGMKPAADNGETWASYPFDESMDLFINTAHDEVITWLSQILNREKKAMDFAQTFAKRNALKHLSGIQKAPGNQWQFPVLAWRPTGDNVVKWDATQYANLQNRVAGVIEGNKDFSVESRQIEMNNGSERVSDEDNFDALEAATDPEDQPDILPPSEKSTPENVAEKHEKKPTPHFDPEPTMESSSSVEPDASAELPSETRQAVTLAEQFPSDFKKAFLDCGFRGRSVESLTKEEAIKVVKVLNYILDSQNDE